MHKYTEEKKKDVQERVDKAIVMLKELQLQPAAACSKVNIGQDGKDIFADLVQPYLQDTKFKDQINSEVGAIPSTNAEVNPNA